MNTPASRWKLGLFVVLGSFVGVVGLVYLGARELQRSTHTAYAYFDEALTGLEEGSAVKFRGITVGKVERIRFATMDRLLEVQASLYEDYLDDLGLDTSKLDASNPLIHRLRAQVVMSFVTSTAFIQVDFLEDPPEGPQMLGFDVPTDGFTLRTVPSTAKSLEASVREVLAELPKLSLELRQLVDLVRTELGAARVPEVSRKLQGLLTKVSGQVDAFADAAVVTAVAEAAGEVGLAAAALRGERDALHGVTQSWTDLGASLRAEVADMALGATAQGVREAAASVESLGAIGADVRDELQNLRRALAAVERLAGMLERDPSSLLRGRGATDNPLKERK
ncbi:MAG: MlaD family protein [Planctomycetota bacterium]